MIHRILLLNHLLWCASAFAPLKSVQHTYKTNASPLFATIPEKETQAEIAEVDEGSKILGKAIPYDQLTVGVLKEDFPGENRVSQSPDSVAMLTKAGLNVLVEAGGTWP